MTLRSLSSTLITALLLVSGTSQAGDIEEQSDYKPESVTRVISIVMIGTSAGNTNRDLGNKQALVGAEVRKLLKSKGVETFPIAIRPDDANPQRAVDEAIQKYSPTHTLSVTVPQGTVFVGKLSGRQISVKDYIVRVELSSAHSNSLVWEYMADVQSTFGASNSRVAESIIMRLQRDGFVQ